MHARRHTGLQFADQRNALLPGDHVKQIREFVNQLRQIRVDGGEFHAPGLELRVIEHPVDQPKLGLRGMIHQIQVAALLGSGHRAAQQFDQADEHDVDLIILGTHGRGVVYQMLVGSTSEGVLRKTSRPVLLVPAGE
ncbi:MAG: hypothetical protein RIS54_779 [Verrucomicrobiota bacterium]|jgi:nucleotide-binding universal stress UspA family protein